MKIFGIFCRGLIKFHLFLSTVTSFPHSEALKLDPGYEIYSVGGMALNGFD